MSPGSIDSPKAKKKMAAKASRSGRTSRSMRLAAAVPASTRPAMKAPIASETPSWAANPATRKREPDEQHDQQLVVTGRDHLAHDLRAVAGEQAEGDEEGEGPHEQQHGLAGAVRLAEHRCQRGEVEGEEEVLQHDDAEDQPRLGVGQPAQLHEELRDDGRRRDAGGAGDDERLLRAPADGEAEGQPGADVQGQVQPGRGQQRAAPSVRSSIENSMPR